MDDGVTEIRELVFSDENDNMSPAEKKQRVEENEEPHSNGGVINNLISSFMSNDKEAENGDGMKDETKEEDETEGGILNNLISSLVSPRSKADDDTFNSVDDEKMVNDEKGGGGVFNNLISGILHGDNKASADGGNEQLSTEKGGGSGGGFIDNLVSQLPSPLSDDAAPATDEASILIHSIVHD